MDDAGAGGLGTVPRRLKGKPDEAAFSGIPSFKDARLVAMPDGEIFQTISQGKGRMPGYATQIPVADRWAIITAGTAIAVRMPMIAITETERMQGA